MKYKKWLIILGALPILIILAGVLKFNFSDSDIFVKNKDGKVVQIDEVDKVDENNKIKKEEKNNEEKAAVELMKIKIPTWKFNEEKDDFEVEWETYEVPKTKAVLNASLKKLFELRSGDKDGKWNGVKFDSVAIRDGVAEVRLSGEWYPAGDMSGMYFGNEIAETVFQYPSVKDLRVYLNDKIFDWCMDDLKDECINENGKKYREELWDTTLEEKF